MPPLNVNVRDLTALLPKLENADSDIRFMSLVDLYNNLQAAPLNILAKEPRDTGNIITKLLTLLDDSNGDVQSQALKNIGPLAIRCSPDVLGDFIDKLTRLNVPKSQDRSIPSTATRYVVLALPRPAPGLPPTKPVEDAYIVISRRLIPRLLGKQVANNSKELTSQPTSGMLEVDDKGNVDVDSIDLLNEMVRCYGPLLRPDENEALLSKLWQIIETNSNAFAKKKAVAGISILTVYLSDQALSKFVSTTIESLRAPHLSASHRRLLISLLGSVARTIPRRFGVYLKTIAEFVLQAVSQDELDELLASQDEDGEIDPQAEEVREAALITLEDFLSSCVNEMRPFTDEALDASIRYLSYDPTTVNDSDDEMDGAQNSDGDDEFADDEDFEEEEALNDDDDNSWKIRRCAAKSLQSLIQTRLNDLMESGILYEKIAPFLVKRFKEREENVRLEVLNSMSFVISKISENTLATTETSSEAPIVQVAKAENKKKRPRGRSDASMFDEPYRSEVNSPGQTPSPTSGPRAEIARLGGSIVQGVVGAFSSKSVSTKQAAVILMRNFANLSHGGLNDHLGKLIEPIVGIIKVTGGFAGGQTVVSTGGAASATGNSLRMESLDFLRTICETHSSKAIAPYLSAMVSGVTAAIDDKYFKVSCNAIDAAEAIIKALTPPRALGSDQKSSSHLKVLYDAIIRKVRANDSDLEVRQRAIHALGVCLIRTSGSQKLLSAADRSEALSTLDERLRSETTRLVSVEAIDSVSMSAVEDDLSEAWVLSVTQELSNQLRKADLRLRVSSMGALKRLATNKYTLGYFDEQTSESLANLLFPLLDVNNLGTLGLAVNILTNLAKKSAQKVVTPSLTNALCHVVTSTLSGPSLDAVLDLVSTIGKQGQGKPLMQDLLDQASLNGDPTVVGAAIGTLIVSGGSSVGVGLKDILNELQTAADDQRRCLALCILGEVSLLQGSSSSIKPESLLGYFDSKSDYVRRIAAISLGRAGSGNTDTYLPVIIKAMKQTYLQSLLLHSIKEILQHLDKSAVDESSQLDIIWEEILEIGEKEDNRVVGAECIGRLVVFDPKKYLPSLQTYLSGSQAPARGLSIQAIRFALSDHDEGLDIALRPVLVPLLVTMLGDKDLENRRLALTTLNSAIKHKPDIVLRGLQQVVPFVIKATEIDLSLVKEVKMGPFVHKVDDGLENRKSAYETLHALLIAAYSRLDHMDLFDRVIAGLGDDHDIKTICNLMLSKLIEIDSDETARRLDAIGQKFQTTLSTKLKDNAVKQEVEKLQEAAKDVLRTTVRLQNKFPGASAGVASLQTPVWRNYFELVKRDFQPQFRSAEEEVKAQE